MIHQIIAPHAPAHTPDSETRQRRSVNRDRDVALNLFEMLRIIVCAIIAHNKTPQDGYPLSIEQVADGVRPIPRELWAHSIQRRMGVLDRMDFDKVRAELMPRDKATISEDGILFKDLYYSCPEARARGWLVEGRRKRKPVEIAFDYRLVDKIVVYSPNGSGESFVAELEGDSKTFQGMSFAEVDLHFKGVKRILASGAEEKRNAQYAYRQLTQSTIDNAVDETNDAVQGNSRSSRKADTADAREAELRSEREAIAGFQSQPNQSHSSAQSMAVAPPPAPSAPPHAPAVKAEVIPMVRKSQSVSSAPHQATSTPSGATTALEDLPLSERIAALRRGLSK